MHELNFCPRVTEYTDYHRYLRDFYEYKKGQNRRFSFRRFAQLAKIKSSNYLMLVMDHRRNLLPSTARTVAEAMKLSRAESDFFVALVKLERARSQEEREQVEREKRIAVQKILKKEIPQHAAEYLRQWYYQVIREFAFLPDFKAEPAWIVDRLRGLVNEAQAESAIRLLVNLGLWKRVNVGSGGGDGGGGGGGGSRIEVCDLFLDTGPEDRSYGDIRVSSIHKQTLTAWCKILEDIPRSERELGLVNIPIHSSKIPELKARIQRFQDEIIGWLQDEKEPTQIVQMGTYMVPVTK